MGCICGKQKKPTKTIEKKESECCPRNKSLDDGFLNVGPGFSVCVCGTLPHAAPGLAKSDSISISSSTSTIVPSVEDELAFCRRASVGCLIVPPVSYDEFTGIDGKLIGYVDNFRNLPSRYGLGSYPFLDRRDMSHAYTYYVKRVASSDWVDALRFIKK